MRFRLTVLLLMATEKTFSATTSKLQNDMSLSPIYCLSKYLRLGICIVGSEVLVHKVFPLELFEENYCVTGKKKISTYLFSIK